MMGIEDVRARARRIDGVDLPSGGRVDFRNFITQDIVTEDDGNAVLAALSEKIVEITYQVEAHERGYHPDGEPHTDARPALPLWLPRAHKALGWAKHHKMITQKRIETIRAGEKRKVSDQAAMERAFVEAARSVLPESEFDRIISAAVAIVNVTRGAANANV